MASSSSYPLWRYDCFLSFCGTDTRRNFVSHLYRELERLGINTFKDDEELERGTYINDQLFKAIEESKFTIAVISENYAFSSFCLEELVKIIECSQNGSLTAIPIFYNIDPSNVRKQRGTLKVAFKKHQKDNLEKVERWKEALTMAANLVGDHSKNWKDDAELIQKISKHIFDQVNRALPGDCQHLVGMDAHMEALRPLLSIGSNEEVRMIGIWGMGGIGKTTIARYMYKVLFSQFQASCFMENVKEIFSSCGETGLQKHFLSKILQESKVQIPSFVEGSDVIKARLGHQKVLVILDDVDKQEQLDCLAGRIDWFGPGSTIIVTSREKQLLERYPIYEVRCLKDDEAIHIFCQYAFKDKLQEDSFLECSKQAAMYAHGHPLALKVWGSFLFGKSKTDWETAIFELERSFSTKIMPVLKVSYDGLEEEAKAIFLYIACHFEGGDIHMLAALLKHRYNDAEQWIMILAKKSLVELSSIGYVSMHDLLKQMGRELVRRETNQPGNRKFLFDSTEICDVLTYARGTEIVEAISLNMSKINDLNINKKAFKKMHNLRFLNFYEELPKTWHEHSSKLQVDGLDYLSCKLVSIRWEWFPLQTLPWKFHPECLVELRMPGSNLERLWEGAMPLWNLKVIDFSNSKNLKRIPDISKAPNLERLEFHRCSSLVEVSSSIRNLQKLATVVAAECTMLKYFPSCRNMKALQRLNLSACFSLKMFPEVSPSIKNLILSSTIVEEIPSSIGLLSELEELHMSHSKIRSIPIEIGNLGKLERLIFYGCSSLVEVPSSIGGLKKLAVLNFSDCKMLEYFPSCHTIEYLKQTILSGCSRLKTFPKVSPSIQNLHVSGTRIEEIPSWIGLLSGLNYLRMSDCKIRSIPREFENLSNLQKLGFSHCNSLVDVSSIGGLQKLSALEFKTCTMLKNLPNCDRMETFQGLYVDGYSSFKMFPQVSPSIERLCLLGTAIEEVPSSIGLLSNLEVLDMSYSKIRSIDGDIGKLSHLRTLNLTGCDLLVDIPKAIQKVESLRKLKVRECKLLRSMPKLPQSLIHLEATGSLSLVVRNTLTLVPTLEFSCNNCSKLEANPGSHKMPCLHYWEEDEDQPIQRVHYRLTIPAPQNCRMAGLLVSFVVKCRRMRELEILTDKGEAPAGLYGENFYSSPLCGTTDPHIFGHYFKKPAKDVKMTFVIKHLPRVKDDCPTEIKDFRVRPLFIEDLGKGENDGLGADVKEEDLLYGKLAADSISGEQEVVEESSSSSSSSFSEWHAYTY